MKITQIVTLFLIVLLSHTYGETGKRVVHPAVVEEHLGKYMPLNLTFKNSDGSNVILKDLIDKPTVIDFVYYRCTGICTPLMVEVADVINKVDLQPGKDYRIISISIDPNETPALAAQKKNELLSLVNKKIDPSSWDFLTGDSASISRAASAAGFYYQKQGNTYLHKGVLIFIDKDGKICRYLRPGYNTRGDFSILPSEFKMAVMEAAQGQVTQTIAKILETCSTFIPKKRDMLVFSVIFLTGIFTIAGVLLIIKKTNLSNGRNKT